MTGIEELYDRLAAAASLDGPEAALRISATYEPAGGPEEKVSPPTYPVGDKENPPYLLEDRWDGSERVKVVLLDSRQAQANRCEEAIQADLDAGRVELPHLALATQVNGMPVRITSLQAPHRSCDAYFRDAETDDGKPFDRSPVGRTGLRHGPASPLSGRSRAKNRQEPLASGPPGRP